MGVIDRDHRGQRLGELDRSRLPFPSNVAWATLPSWSTRAASSSGTRCPRVVTHSDEMASK